MTATLNSTPNTTFHVNSIGDTPCGAGLVLGTTDVTTNASGNATFSATVFNTGLLAAQLGDVRHRDRNRPERQHVGALTLSESLRHDRPCGDVDRHSGPGPGRRRRHVSGDRRQQRAERRPQRRRRVCFHGRRDGGRDWRMSRHGHDVTGCRHVVRSERWRPAQPCCRSSG